jgi:hypothetical protein
VFPLGFLDRRLKAGDDNEREEHIDRVRPSSILVLTGQQRVKPGDDNGGFEMS